MLVGGDYQGLNPDVMNAQTTFVGPGVKIIADAKTDRIIGAQILAANAGELISEVVTHMAYGGSAEDLARTIHAHPTVSEAVREAGLAVSRSALHAL